jgi:beta-lactam-binding protein with PASTA domain
MNMNKTLWVVVLIIIVALAWWLFSGRGEDVPAEEGTDETAAAVEAVVEDGVVEDVVDEADEETVEDEA